METNHSIGKIEDAGIVVRGGAIDRYWFREGLQLPVHRFFNETPKHDWLFDSQLALEHFNLRSIEFGNWMSQEDRALFLYSAMLSLHHLAHILGIEDAQIGMKGKLSIALGARGRGRAMAHYEPNPFAVINITKTKGFGSLAHEFAHAVDNIISYHTGNKNQTYVSGGRSTRKGFDETIAQQGNWFEQQFEQFFNVLYFTPQGKNTPFYNYLRGTEEYWQRRTEVFARTFEVFVHSKLQALGIKDAFLVKASYLGKVYPKGHLITQVSPIISKLMTRAFNLMKRSKPLAGIATVNGYQGFRKTLKLQANVEDTLANMQRIAYRDAYQVRELAQQLQGNTVAETAENIWNYLRANTRYKLDQHGIEELRTPARSLVDGKAGITNPAMGIDCDDYTILISAILLNLGIKHEFRVTAYKEKGKFQHIYPVAYDTNSTPYILDVVPEIPHFNYEAKPIVDLKIIPMELHELSGVQPTLTENELQHDLIEELNQPFELAGFDDENDGTILERAFLSGFGEVATEDEADIVLSSLGETLTLIENGLLSQLNKAKHVLLNEQKQPTVLSQTINVAKELALINNIMRVWDSDTARANAITTALNNSTAYTNFYKAMQLSLQELESDDLSGLEDEFEAPMYLARMDDDNIDEELQGLGFFKKVFRKVGRGLKKVVKAVVRFNPATIVVRAAILLVLKINLFKIASRLIYGYLTESQARAKGLDLNEWRKLVRAKGSAERFYTKIGGKASKFKRAIVRGKAAKKTGLQLGAAVTGGSTAAASGFIVFAKKLLSAINPAKLFKKVAEKIKAKRSTNTNVNNTMEASNYTQPQTMQTTAVPTQKQGFISKLKTFLQQHKKKILVGGLGIVVVVIAVVVYKKKKAKNKRSLAGIKSARTRARNRKRLLASNTNQSTRKRKRTPQLKGSTTILKIPTKSVKRARVSKRSNGNRLKLMHQKAKQLQKKHPKTKYSTLLARASKLI